MPMQMEMRMPNPRPPTHGLQPHRGGPFPHMTAAAAAAMAGDQGRRPDLLPWLYLDSLGHEYGPVPGRTMAEWMACGRFPVGGSLRVRLPEWRQHIMLYELYPDLEVAFVLPPAWPDDDESSNLGPGVRRALRSGGGSRVESDAKVSEESETLPPAPPAPPPAAVCVVAPCAPAAQPWNDDGKQSLPPGPEDILERLLRPKPLSKDVEPLLPPPPAQPSPEELHKLWGAPGATAPEPQEKGPPREEDNTRDRIAQLPRTR